PARCPAGTQGPPPRTLSSRIPPRSCRWITIQRDRLPVARCVVVLIDAAAVFRGPQKILVHVVARGVLERLAVDIDQIAAPLGVVAQRGPRQRMILLADSQKAAERSDGVDRLAAHLVDQDVVDGTELLTLRVVDAGSFHLVGGDQSSGRDLADVGHDLTPTPLLPPINAASPVPLRLRLPNCSSIC